MLGAIKRRWKSKKAKVLHKGTTSDLSSSSDSCPVTRGAFVDPGADGSNEKAGTKPPSPRQIHPISEKTDVKCTLTNLNQSSPQRNSAPGSNGTATTTESGVGRKGPSSPRHQRGIQKKDIGSPAAFIHVNSGRIELVSGSSKDNSSTPMSTSGCGGGLWKPAGASVSPRADSHGATTTTEKLRRLSGRLRTTGNDSRHSWCAGGGDGPLPAMGFRHPDHGSHQHQNNNLGFRPKIKGGDPAITLQSRLLGPIQLQGPGVSPERKKPESHQHNQQQQRQLDEEDDEEENTYSVPTDESNPEEAHRTLRLRTVLLEDRLRLMEGLTGNLANCRIMDKNEYEKCMTELTSQVSRAVSLQQIMKTEVEKLATRIVELESHNNTMASMIIPTLMKLEETIANSTPRHARSMDRVENTNRSPARRAAVGVGGGQSNRDYVPNMNKKSKADIIRYAGACKRSPTRNPSARQQRNEENELAMSPPINSNLMTTTNASKEELLSNNCSSTNTNPLLSTRVSTRITSTTNSTGRLSPLSKSESSSITRSTSASSPSRVRRNGVGSSQSSSKLPGAGVGGGGAKKSFTYSGIPRIASASPCPGNSNATNCNVNGSASAPRANASCNSSPVKTSITKSPLFSNSSPSGSPKNNAVVGKRNFSSSPGLARDLHNNSSSNASNCNGNANGNGSRLPVLRKSTNLKKLINSFDGKKNSSVPPSGAHGNLLTSKSKSGSGSGSSSLHQQEQDNSLPPLHVDEEGHGDGRQIGVVGVPGGGGGLGVQTHKDEGYSTMSSEALAEQENNNTLIISGNTLEKKSDGGVGDSDRINAKNECSTTGTGADKKRFGFGASVHAHMRKSNTVNTFLPGVSSSNSSGSSPTNCPSEQRKLMMMRDAERRLNNLICRNVRICDNEGNTSLAMAMMTTTSGGDGGEVTSNSLPCTSTRQQTKTKRGYNYGYDADDDEHEHANEHGHTHVHTHGTGDDEEDPSTILWEDSDDSDILFLPLEVSSEDQSNSVSTLVPLTTSLSDQSTSCNNCNSSTTTNNSTLSGHETQYPLRRTKGEEFVALLSSKLAHHQRNVYMAARMEPNNAVAEDEIEERALIEKWMKLEDVRNQVGREEEWAWDWDGVERTKRHPLARYQSNRAPPMEIDHPIACPGPERHQQQQTSEQSNESWKNSSNKCTNATATASMATKNSLLSTRCSDMEAGSSRTFTRDVVTPVAADKSKIDSNTWTKSSRSNSRNMTIKNDANFINESKEKLSSTSNSQGRNPGSAGRGHGGGVQLQLQSRDEEKSSKVSNEWKSMKQDEDDENESSVQECCSLIKKEHERGGEEIPGEAGMIDNSLLSLNAERNQTNSPSPPPAIEFTPEYYHLVNLYSSSSGSGSKNLESCNYFSRRRSSKDGDAAAAGVGDEANQTMDDKISQTDFTCSLDSLSVSSELFTECRNCLELIKRLVGSGDETEDEDKKAVASSTHAHTGLHTDMGSATTWVSVPKGVSNTEVNRILEILSSSESEDILSPSK